MKAELVVEVVAVHCCDSYLDRRSGWNQDVKQCKRQLLLTPVSTQSTRPDRLHGPSVDNHVPILTLGHVEFDAFLFASCPFLLVARHNGIEALDTCIIFLRRAVACKGLHNWHHIGLWKSGGSCWALAHLCNLLGGTRDAGLWLVGGCCDGA